MGLTRGSEDSGESPGQSLNFPYHFLPRHQGFRLGRQNQSDRKRTDNSRKRKKISTRGGNYIRPGRPLGGGWKNSPHVPPPAPQSPPQAHRISKEPGHFATPSRLGRVPPESGSHQNLGKDTRFLFKGANEASFEHSYIDNFSKNKKDFSRFSTRGLDGETRQAIEGALFRNIRSRNSSIGSFESVDVMGEKDETIDSSESGWGTEPPEEDHQADKNSNEADNHVALEKATNIIEQMGHPWKMVFSEEFASLKTTFKDLAFDAEKVLSDDCTLAHAIGKQLELNSAAENETRNKLVESFGDALEAAVQIQNHIDELHGKLHVITQEKERATKEFLKTLVEMRTRHADNLQNMKSNLHQEIAALRAMVQDAKSSKTEQKDMQRHLARALAAGLG